MTDLDAARTAAAELDRFRARVMADAALQAELAAPRDLAAFVALAVARAAEAGIALDPELVAALAKPDRIGAARWLPTAEFATGWPGDGWLPAHLGLAPEPYMDWAHFAGAPLAEPFFEESLGAAQARPFNGLFRHRTPLADFVASAAGCERAPDGLIFHMSRCGSTLVSQMLAASAANTVLSEARPLDDALLAEAMGFGDGALAATVSAVGRRRSPGDRRLFVKAQCWHALAWPLYRRAFPATPWVFLYRDPLAVMVSQLRERGVETTPGLLPLQLPGLDPAAMASDEYCAALLGRVCAAAAAAFGQGGGLLVGYDELPDALWTRILPHFGVTLDDGEREAMARAAGRDAKAPQRRFAPDAEAKRSAATERLAELVDRHMAEPHRRLVALRGG
jgi:hypothetical protein